MALDSRQVELAVLLEVVDLHPAHLAPAELVLRLSGDRNEGDELRNAIRELEGSGLLRCIGGTIGPTDAALHAVRLLTL